MSEAIGGGGRGSRGPSGFDELMARARARADGGARVGMAVAWPHDAVVLGACRTAADAGLAHPVLVGVRDEIERVADAAGVDVTGFPVEPARDPGEAARRAAALVRAGLAGMVMKGHLSTPDILRAVLDREHGLRPAAGVLSHVAAVEALPRGRLLLVTDGGINILPDLERKEAILTNAIAAARRVGIERPRVALVAATETVSAEMPATTDAVEIVRRWQRGDYAGAGEALVDGPLGLDMAVSPAALAAKGSASRLEGAADVLLVPNIETGNLLVKALIYCAGARSAGVVVGATAPVVLLSRADDVATKLHSIAMGVLLAG